MAGLRWEVQGLDEALAALSRLVENRPLMLAMLGAEVESQTRDRIGSERAAPDGTPWPAWSPKASHHAGQSLLQASGALIDSIHYVVDGDEVAVGSGLVYAGIHHFGGVIKPKNGRFLHFMGAGGASVFLTQVTMPARPYFGLSPANENHLMETVADYITRQLSGG